MIVTVTVEWPDDRVLLHQQVANVVSNAVYAPEYDLFEPIKEGFSTDFVSSMDATVTVSVQSERSVMYGSSTQH